MCVMPPDALRRPKADFLPLAYFDELEESLQFIKNTPDLSIDEKRRFFKSANTNLGVSALCLSGGGSFGYCKRQLNCKHAIET